MEIASNLSTFADRIIAVMDASAAAEGGLGLVADDEFNRLALNLFRLQAESNAAYARLLSYRGLTPSSVGDWRDIPCLPTAAFKEWDVTSLAVDERSCVFRSSGTTQGDRGRHFHHAASLEVYEKSLFDWFVRNMTDRGTRLDELSLVSLTPAPEAVADSSLVHMFGTVAERGRWVEVAFLGGFDAAEGWSLEPSISLPALDRLVAAGRPMLLVGTAFNFVQLLDAVRDRGTPLVLPAGSRVLETGGYKGRTREMPKSVLYAEIGQLLGVEDRHIVSEYGMSELSSQAYDGLDRDGDAERRFRFSPWARVRVISPESGEEVPDGDMGLIQVFDLANVWSVLAVQTEDLGIRKGDGFSLLGRVSGGESKGCSLHSVESA